MKSFGGGELAVFLYAAPVTGGALQVGANRSAEAGSAIRIYLDCMPSLDAALARIESAGGQIVQPKTALSPGIGFIAHQSDTDGNEVGLHSTT